MIVKMEDYDSFTIRIAPEVMDELKIMCSKEYGPSGPIDEIIDDLLREALTNRMCLSI